MEYKPINNNNNFNPPQIAYIINTPKMGQQNTKSNLFIKVTLGQTQSHELFDFQTGGFELEQQLVGSTSFIVDKGETVEFVPESELMGSKDGRAEQAIYKVSLDEYQQITIKDLGQAETRDLWRVVKPGECQAIRPGDTLKIGKIKLELKKVVEKRQQNHYEQETVKDFNQEVIGNDDAESVHSGHSNLDRCRICFSSHSKENNPLLCLCKCSGSIKWVHFLCQKDWIANTLSKRQDEYCKFYTYNQTACQLCKHALPNEFQHEGKAYSFLDFSKFEPPYAEFEYNEMENGKRKFYKYLISLQKDKEVAIGRNNASQVIMKDISISRTHCSLEYKHGMVLVRDKKSKFGTLIKVDKTLEFSSETGLQLQFDSKLIELYNNNTFKSCCRDVDSYRLVYEQSEDGLRQNRITSVSNRENYSADTRHLLGINAGEVNFEILRMESGLESESSERMVMEDGLVMEENIEGVERSGSPRATMVRETMARDQAIRY